MLGAERVRGAYLRAVQGQVQDEPMDSKTVALGHLIRYWPWTNEQIGLLLVDILNGEMVSAGVLKSGKGVGTLVLHVHDLDHWFAGKQRVTYVITLYNTNTISRTVTPKQEKRIHADYRAWRPFMERIWRVQ